MKRLFLFILLTSFFVSCVSSTTENLLNDVETYISERPDSALMVLDSIDRDLLITQKTKSHHALLYAMALDKNYINVSEDSLAMTALKYYGKHGDKKYRARSLYYLGLSYYYSKEYDKAILEFTKAEEVAQKHDSLFLGMIKIAQADTYSNTYNEVEEYNSLCEAYDVFKNISAEYYLNVSKYRLAKSLINQGSYSISDSLLIEVIESSEAHSKLMSAALTSYAYSKVIRSDYDMIEAVNLYEKIQCLYDTSFMDVKDYWAWAYSLYCLKRYEESEELINQLRNTDTTIVADYWLYVIAKESSDYAIALDRLEKTVEKNEKEVENALKQELSLVQRDYYASQSELTTYKMHARTMLLTCAIVFILMVTGYLLLLFRRYIRKQREEKERYMEYVAEITRQLDAVNNESTDSLKRKYIDLYKSKFEVLRFLSDQFLQTENRVDAEEKMYRKVISLVDEIRNDEKHRAKFEAMLDNDLDGIMSNFRKELPKLKEIDYAIFSYWIIGFDVTTISRLLDTSLNIVYIRKTRIKQHIKEKSPEHMEQFLEMIS